MGHTRLHISSPTPPLFPYRSKLLWLRPFLFSWDVSKNSTLHRNIFHRTVCHPRFFLFHLVVSVVLNRVENYNKFPIQLLTKLLIRGCFSEHFQPCPSLSKTQPWWGISSLRLHLPQLLCCQYFSDAKGQRESWYFGESSQ